MITENDLKWIEKIELEYLAYKLNKYYDEDMGGTVYSCLLHNGEGWSKEEEGIGKTLELAIARAINFFPPILIEEETEDEIEAMRRKIEEWENRKK